MSLQRTKKKISADPTPAPANDPFIDEKYLGDPYDLANQIISRFEMYKKPRLIWDALIYQSVAMYAGYQNLLWNGTGLAPDIPSDTNSSQAVSNRIIGKCNSMVNRMVSFDPTAQELPASPSTEDVYGARACTKIIKSNHQAYGYKAVYKAFAEFIVIEGDGFLKTQYDHFGGRKTVTYRMEPTFQMIELEATQENQDMMDELAEWEEKPMQEVEENGGIEAPNNGQANNTDSQALPQTSEENTHADNDYGGELGDVQTVGESPQSPDDAATPPQAPQIKRYKVPVKHPVTGKPQMRQVRDEETGNPLIDKLEFDGRVKKSAIGPMNMFYNPVILNWEDAFDCVEVQYLSIDVIKNTYAAASNLAEKDYENNDFNPWVQVFKTVIERNPYGTQWGIPVYEYHCKSCEAFPRGLKVIVIKGKIVAGGPEETFNGDELPYDHSGFDPIPGCFRHLSLPMILTNPQKIRNMLLSQYINNAKLFEIGRVLAQEGTKFSDKITNGNQVIYYKNAGNIPTFMNPSAISGAHEKLIDRMDNDIDTLSGISKTAEGNPPPSVTSAEMSESVTENDYKGTGLVVDMFMLAISKSCNKELRLMQDSAPDDILVRFFGGPGGKTFCESFKKTVLRNLPDVAIIPGKSLSESRASKRKDIELMLPIVTQQAGNPDQQKIIIDKVLDWMEWGDEEAMVAYLTKQQNCIMDKICELKASANLPDFQIRPMPWHDMKIWMDVLETELLNEVQFNKEPEVTKKRLIDLYDEIQKILTQQQQQAAMKMGGGQLPPGGPPKPGLPPGAPPPGGHPQGPPPGLKAQALQTQQQAQAPKGV